MRHLRLTWCLVILGCGSPQSPVGYYREKYSPPAVKQQPKRIPSELKLQSQVEGHTCGLHALSSIYIAHGLNPKEARLRFRLGVDKKAIPLKDSTKGTLHPDLFRVGSQDGFKMTAVDPRKPQAGQTLSAHSKRKLYSLSLVKITGTSIFHWVTLGSASRSSITPCMILSQRNHTRFEPQTI